MSTPLSVGPLAPRHRPRVAEILESTAVFRREEVDVALELFDEAVAVPPASSSYAFLGAFTPDGELAAYACFGPTPATDRTWDLYWIAVHRAAQGRGGGTRLLSEVERRLQELQARMVVVETSSRSEYDATRAFYRARGYVEAAHVREFYAPADDRIILTKRFHEPVDGRGVVAS